MYVSLSRFSISVVVMVSLAGCGGSSNSSSSGGGGNGGGGSSTTVTYTFTGTMPTAVATRIGTGAFTQASLESGKLSVSVPSGETNYSVAYVCPAYTINGFGVNLEGVIQANIIDGASLSETCKSQTSSPSTGLATLQVNAAAIPGTYYVFVQSFWQLWTGSTLTFSNMLNTGSSDVAVYAADASGKVLAVQILRNQTVPGALNGGNPVVFETTDETHLEPISYASIPTGFSATLPGVAFYTAGGAFVPLGIDVTTKYPAMPSAAVQSGDYYSFGGEAFGGSLSESVFFLSNTTSGGPLVINLPAGWTYAGPSPAALPTFDFNYAGFSGKTDVLFGAGITWSLSTTSIAEVEMSATANYQNGSTSLPVPDLSGVTGFLAPAPSGTTVGWAAEVSQGALTGGSSPGGSQSIVIDSGSFTEP
jgi:hypothetical protein